jgi:adenylate cyclase
LRCTLELISAEARRPIADLDALDYILRGRATWLKSRSRDNYAEEISLFERALALDPGSVEAQSLLAGALAGRVLDQMTDTAAADIARAEELAGRALVASPRSPLAHLAKGQVFRAQGRYQEAIPEYETVLAFNRNAVIAIYALSSCKLYTGSIEEVIPVVEQAIRLSPSDPYIGRSYIRIALVHLLQSHIDEAISWSEKAPPIPDIRLLTPISPPRVRSKATLNALPPNSPRPEG